MVQLLGLVRIILILLLLLSGAAFVLITAVIPGRIRGIKLAAWVCRLLALGFNQICNIRISCSNVARFHNHHGFIFPNHVSYLEPVILFSILPSRFMAAIEVKRRPLIGWIAQAVDTVFVTREDRSSRHQAREDVKEAFMANSFPPIVIFPEGRLGPGDQLNPLRYGAFEMAANCGAPFMPCAIRYSRNDIAIWFGGAGETLFGAFWRLAKFPGPLYVEVMPLESIQPAQEDCVPELSRRTRQLIGTALGYDPNADSDYD